MDLSALQLGLQLGLLSQISNQIILMLIFKCIPGQADKMPVRRVEVVQIVVNLTIIHIMVMLDNQVIVIVDVQNHNKDSYLGGQVV